MRILKIAGVVVLGLVAIPMGFQVVLSGLALMASVSQASANSISYFVGRFTGSLLVFVLVVAGLVKLARSLRD